MFVESTKKPQECEFGVISFSQSWHSSLDMACLDQARCDNPLVVPPFHNW